MGPDDCANNMHGCHSDATCIPKQATYGSKVSGYKCTCNDGFYGNGKECYPEINECADVTRLPSASTNLLVTAVSALTIISVTVTDVLSPSMNVPSEHTIA